MNPSNANALARPEGTTLSRETSTASVAAKAQAIVQARYLVAMQRPRDWDDVRTKLLKACRRPGFAERAIYSKPVGGNSVEGPSIRFAEEAARAMGNVDIDTPTLYDDPEKRIIQVVVTDLEANTTYSVDVTITKTVERSKVREGQLVVGTRTNTYGNTVYIVAATDDELLNKVNNLMSKAIRQCILRVVPSDIVEEALWTVGRTLQDGDRADPDAARKRVADAFAGIGVQPSDLKRLLGHELATCSPNELAELRKVFSAIRDGETSWGEVLRQRAAEQRSGEDDDEPKAAASVSKMEAAKAIVKNRARRTAGMGLDDGAPMPEEPPFQ